MCVFIPVLLFVGFCVFLISQFIKENNDDMKSGW
jgi:hypothetical protein